MIVAFYLESVGNTGGVNRVVSIIASKLAEKGYTVHIISRYEGKEALFELHKDVRLHELFPHFKSKYLTFGIEYIRLRKIVRDNRIDLLISAGATFFTIAHFIKRVRHFEWDHVSFWHGNKMLQWGRRLAARKADKVIVLTNDNKVQFEKIKGCRAEIVRIFNPETFVPDVVSDINSKNIISVGYIGKQKGYDMLVKAWQLIPVQLKKEWTLQIAGEDEGDLAFLQEYIAKNEIEGIKFLGFRTDIKQLMAESAFYVMSSRWEGLPMVLIEAQTLGLPIVSFDCKTGPKDIVAKDTGILIRENDIQGMANALERMMTDIGFRKICQEKALEAAQRFRVGSIVEQWIKVINN